MCGPLARRNKLDAVGACLEVRLPLSLSNEEEEGAEKRAANFIGRWSYIAGRRTRKRERESLRTREPLRLPACLLLAHSQGEGTRSTDPGVSMRHSDSSFFRAVALSSLDWCSCCSCYKDCSYRTVLGIRENFKIVFSLWTIISLRNHNNWSSIHRIFR